MEAVEENKDDLNGKAEAAKADAAPEEPKQQPEESGEDPKKKQARLIIEKAEHLYDHFKGAGFSRDAYIELGESVKAGKGFKQLLPAVQKLIMKVAKGVHDL